MTVGSLLVRLRAKMGDFWWYTLLLFAAARIGDVINAIVGLWLVPKYVPQEELGAVLPLLQTTTFFGLPLTILVMTFTKFLNSYQTLGQRGKVKSLIRTFWGFATVAVILGTALALWLMPHVFERIRVASGSLGVLILAASILGTTSPVFCNALQALKRFRTLTMVNLLSAPVRLVTMLVAMPFRALSGYMLGQATPHAFAILASCFALRKEIRNDVKSEPFWREDWKPILRYTAFVALSYGVGSILTIVQPIIVRQRLPEVESAAYYMISRFSDLATFAGQTLICIIFPFAAEAQAAKTNAFPLFIRGTCALFAFGLLCSLGFWIFGGAIFRAFPLWSPYAAYAPQMAVLAIISTLGIFTIFFATYEMAGARFMYLAYFLPTSLFHAAFLVCFAGWAFWRGILPDAVVEAMAALRVDTLHGYLWTELAFGLIAALQIALHLFLRHRQKGCVA